MRIRVGDEVKVVAGKDRGKVGKVEKVFPKEKKLLVSGVNLYKRHRKGRGNLPSEIVTIAKPLAVANIALICSHCHKQTRVGFVLSDGKKRICRKCEVAI